MIEFRAKAADFGAFLDRTVGHYGYLIGTRGQTITQNMIDYRLSSDRYQKYWANIREYAPKLLAGNPDKGETVEEKDAWKVADCMGWFECFLNGGDIGNPLVANEYEYPDTQTGPVYELAKTEGLPNGLIATLPKDCAYPIAVGYDGHVGFFHKGKVYQSIGHRRGTIITELSYGANNHQWDYWYYLPWLDYSTGSSGGGEPEMIICKRGETAPVINALQLALVKLYGKLTGSDGTVYYAADTTEFYGSATSAGLAQLQQDNGLKVDGDQFDVGSLVVLLKKLIALQSADPALKIELDAAKKNIVELGQELAVVKNQLLIEESTSANWAADAAGKKAELVENAQAWRTLQASADKH